MLAGKSRYTTPPSPAFCTFFHRYIFNKQILSALRTNHTGGLLYATPVHDRRVPPRQRNHFSGVLMCVCDRVCHFFFSSSPSSPTPRAALAPPAANHWIASVLLTLLLFTRQMVFEMYCGDIGPFLSMSISAELFYSHVCSANGFQEISWRSFGASVNLS